MTRDEIRAKYMTLTKEVVKGNVSREVCEQFQQLHEACSHPYGGMNYEIGSWMCPDCGQKEKLNNVAKT